VTAVKQYNEWNVEHVTGDIVYFGVVFYHGNVVNHTSQKNGT